MNEKERVRKYMLHDIMKQNLKYWWLILGAAILCACYLGVTKNGDYQKRFEKMRMTGTTYTLSTYLYTGNINSDSVRTRVENVKTLVQSNSAYEKYLVLTGYDISYSEYIELFITDTDYDSDYLDIRFNYPVAIGEKNIYTEEEARPELSKYITAVMQSCNEVIGDSVVKDLGMNQVTERDNLPTDENYKIARQEVAKQIFVGIIMGAVILISLITLIYLLDARVKTAQEIAACMSLPLLAHFVKKNRDAEYEKLRLLLADGDGKIINFMGMKGTESKCAKELACTIHRSGKKTLFIDTDNAVEGIGLEDCVHGTVPLEKAAKLDACGLSIISKNAHKVENDIFEIDGYRQFLESARSAYDCIVIKVTDKQEGLNNVCAAKECDKVVIEAENRRHKETDIYKFMETLHLFEIDCRGVVVYEPQK